MPVLLDSASAIRLLSMNLLARREHSRVELKRKLIMRGAPEELIDMVLDRLAEQELLSESRYLESYIRQRSNAGYGPLRIQEELIQRGSARPDIKTALQRSHIDWHSQLRTTWYKKFSGSLPKNQYEYAKQLRFLSYRGYSADSIKQLLKQ